MYTPEDDAAMQVMFGPEYRQMMTANALRVAQQQQQAAPQPAPQPVPQPQTAPQPQPAPAPRPDDLYQQAAYIRARAYGLKPDPQMLAEARAKAEQGARNGIVIQMLGGSRLAPVGGAVLRQALRRQSELELNPEREAARDFRALEAEAAALERRAQSMQNAEDRAELQRQAQEARLAAQRERAADRAAIAAAVAANRQEPLVQVQMPDGSVQYAPRSQAVGMSPPARAGRGAGASGAGTAGRLPAEIGRMQIAFNALDKTLDEYETALRQFGVRSTNQLSPEQRAIVNSLHTRLQLEAKEAAALGALTGPDMELLSRLTTDPTSMRGVVYGDEGLLAQVRGARNWVAQRRKATNEVYPQAQPPADDGYDPSKARRVR